MAFKELTELIRKEMCRHSIPFLSIALINEGGLIHYEEFDIDGSSTGTKKHPSIFRAGSISKTLNAISIMQQSEQGVIDIDRPVSEYCPELRFHNRFNKSTPITIRHLISHTAGLQRESPVGSYFDNSEPGIKRTVASIIDTELIYPPATRYKYSNIGPTIAAYVLESVTGIPFYKQIENGVFGPLGMNNSFFSLRDNSNTSLIPGALITGLNGLPFLAPEFELGTSASGGLYSTGPDLAALVACFLSQGDGESSKILNPDTLKSMYIPQLESQGNISGFGLGLIVGTDNGSLFVRHGGAIYGFSAECYALIDENIGVVVLNNLDCADGVNVKIRTAAVEIIRAARDRRTPILPSTSLFDSSPSHEDYKGFYCNSDTDIQVDIDSGVIVLHSNGTRKRLRPISADKFVTDDRQNWGTEVIFQRDGTGSVSELTVSGKIYEKALPGCWKISSNNPAPYDNTKVLEKYCGDYGQPHALVRILIRDGRLCCIIEWLYEYPLTMIDNRLFQFPHNSMYEGESLLFETNTIDKIMAISLSGIRFERIQEDE